MSGEYLCMTQWIYLFIHNLIDYLDDKEVLFGKDITCIYFFSFLFFFFFFFIFNFYHYFHYRLCCRSVLYGLFYYLLRTIISFCFSTHSIAVFDLCLTRVEHIIAAFTVIAL